MEFHGNSQNSVKCVEFMISEEIPAFQWNAPQKHQWNLWFPWCSGVGAEGAGFARKTMGSADLWKVEWKVRSEFWFPWFRGKSAPFAAGAEKHGIPIGLLRFPGCHFLQNHRFHGNPGFLWNSRISVKISGLHGNPRFPRKCGSRRKWHLKNSNKCLGISCFSTPATRKAGFPWKTWKSAEMTGKRGNPGIPPKTRENRKSRKTRKTGIGRKGGPQPGPARGPLLLLTRPWYASLFHKKRYVLQRSDLNMPRFPTFLTLNEELCSEILKTRFCTCSRKKSPQRRKWKWWLFATYTSFLDTFTTKTMKSLWKRNVILRFLRLALCFQRLFMFSAQLLIKYVHQLPEKLISQIRRCGKISFTSKEDFDLSGFSEIRNGFPWFLYPKITPFLRICLKTKGHRSPKILLKFYIFRSPDFPRFILGHFWGPKKTRKSQNRKNRKGAKKGENCGF